MITHFSKEFLKTRIGFAPLSLPFFRVSIQINDEEGEKNVVMWTKKVGTVSSVFANQPVQLNFTTFEEEIIEEWPQIRIQIVDPVGNVVQSWGQVLLWIKSCI